MNAALLQLFVTIIGQLINEVLGATGSASATTVSNVISLLENILPDVIKAGGEIVTMVQNIIAALKGTQITPEQWAALDAFEKQIDTDFDQAATDEGL